jgi:hypothetical protein
VIVVVRRVIEARGARPLSSAVARESLPITAITFWRHCSLVTQRSGLPSNTMSSSVATTNLDALNPRPGVLRRPSDRVTDSARLTLSVLSNVADALPIPFLKGIAATSLQVVELSEVRPFI